MNSMRKILPYIVVGGGLAALLFSSRGNAAVQPAVPGPQPQPGPQPASGGGGTVSDNTNGGGGESTNGGGGEPSINPIGQARPYLNGHNKVRQATP